MTVNPASNTVIANIRVYGISEVDHGRALRQLHDVAFGGKHVDIIREQIVFDVFDKL